MYDGLYTLRYYSELEKNSVVNFPITVREIPVGEQSEQYFHEHDTCEMALITAGEGVHILAGERATVRTGDVLVIYPGQRHGYDACNTLGLINLLSDPRQLPFPILDGGKIPLFRRFFPHQLAAENLPHSAEPILHFPSQEAMAQVRFQIRLLDQELKSHQPGNMMVSVVKLLDIVLSTLRLAKMQVEDVNEKRIFPLDRILEYINKNYTREISLEQLVKTSIYSKRVFQYKFKELTGYSMTDYILHKRMALAQDLLAKSPELSIGEVAYQCGFLDQNYFSRKFREVTGNTPRDYRRIENG